MNQYFKNLNETKKMAENNLLTKKDLYTLCTFGISFKVYD